MRLVDDLGVSKRRQRLRGELGSFVQQYARKPGRPNDRRYSREVEQHVKQMDPRELDELLHGDDDLDEAYGRRAFSLLASATASPSGYKQQRIASP